MNKKLNIVFAASLLAVTAIISFNAEKASKRPSQTTRENTYEKIGKIPYSGHSHEHEEATASEESSHLTAFRVSTQTASLVGNLVPCCSQSCGTSPFLDGYCPTSKESGAQIASDGNGGYICSACGEQLNSDGCHPYAIGQQTLPLSDSLLTILVWLSIYAVLLFVKLRGLNFVLNRKK
jgi:hypothetical protein